MLLFDASFCYIPNNWIVDSVEGILHYVVGIEEVDMLQELVNMVVLVISYGNELHALM